MAPTSENINETSSLNNYVICAHCGGRYTNKTALISHVKTCVYNRTCSICKLTFKNRGNLFNHCQHIHGDVSHIKGTEQYACSGCPNTYKRPLLLRHHIRDVHFNMIAVVTECEKRNIKEVWYERVLNSDELVQITKTGPNSYLMRRTKDVGFVTCSPKNSIDLSKLYPTKREPRGMFCKICKKSFKMDIKTHMKSRHPGVDIDRL